MSRNSICKILLIAALVGLGIWAFRHFNLESLLSENGMQSFIQTQGSWGPVAFIIFYTCIIIAFLPITPFAIAAGAMFGLWPSLAYVVIGATLGATGSFYISRYLGAEWVRKVTHSKFKALHQYDKKVAENGFKTVLLVRLIPFLPFKGPNYIFGLSRVRDRDYILGTLIGVIPESFVFVYIGSTLASFSFKDIILVSCILGVIFLAWGTWQHRRSK